MVIRDCHYTAAQMLCGDSEADPARLHGGIIACLDEIDDLCAAAGGRLRSRQVIAQFIFAWQNANPTATAYQSEAAHG